MTEPSRPTVYHDGSCPLCMAEVAWYQRAGGNVTYADVSRNELPDGLSREDAMARFHYRDADGRLLSGAAAFASLWLHLTQDRPLLRPLAKLADTRPALLLGELGYRAFLLVRPRLQRLARQWEAGRAR